MLEWRPGPANGAQKGAIGAGAGFIGQGLTGEWERVEAKTTGSHLTETIKRASEPERKTVTDRQDREKRLWEACSWSFGKPRALGHSDKFLWALVNSALRLYWSPHLKGLLWRHGTTTPKSKSSWLNSSPNTCFMLTGPFNCYIISF